MDKEENERLADWIRTKWHHGPCPICQTNNYGPGMDVAMLIPLKSETSGLGATPPRGPYLVFPILCTNCGYTILVNANVAGVVPMGGNILLPPGTEEAPSA